MLGAPGPDFGTWETTNPRGQCTGKRFPNGAAEKLIEGRKKCQGTALAVPQAQQNLRGLQPRRDAFLPFRSESNLFRSLFIPKKKPLCTMSNST
jgi:hypothetical protein